MRDKGIEFNSSGAARVHPDKNQVELGDGSTLDYDYLVIATGPKLAFDEVEGLGPEANTHSVCHVDHAVAAGRAYDAFVEDPAAARTMPGASGSSTTSSQPRWATTRCVNTRSASRCASGIGFPSRRASVIPAGIFIMSAMALCAPTQ